MSVISPGAAMNKLTVVLCSMLCISCAALSVVAQNAGANQPSTGASVRLEPVKQLRKGVDKWPMIAAPANPAEQHVNAVLTLLNRTLSTALVECDQNARESFKQLGDDAPKGQDPTAGDWSRTVKVTMTGPRFLSIVATDETSCGGAHPDSDTIAMVFDLTTGRPVNWMALIAPSAKATTFSDSITDGTKVGALIVPAMKPILLAAAASECKDSFEDPQSYQFWPDAARGRLIALAFDLPHAVAACADEIPLTPDQARKLGFDEALLGAIEQAHRQSAAAPSGSAKH